MSMPLINVYLTVFLGEILQNIQLVVTYFIFYNHYLCHLANIILVLLFYTPILTLSCSLNLFINFLLNFHERYLMLYLYLPLWGWRNDMDSYDIFSLYPTCLKSMSIISLSLSIEVKYGNCHLLGICLELDHVFILIVSASLCRDFGIRCILLHLMVYLSKSIFQLAFVCALTFQKLLLCSLLYLFCWQTTLWEKLSRLTCICF